MGVIKWSYESRMSSKANWETTGLKSDTINNRSSITWLYVEEFRGRPRAFSSFYKQ